MHHLKFKTAVCVLFLNTWNMSFCTSDKFCSCPTTGKLLSPGSCRNSPPSCATTTWAFTFTPVPRCDIRYAFFFVTLSQSTCLSGFSALHNQDLHTQNSIQMLNTWLPECLIPCSKYFEIHFHITISFFFPSWLLPMWWHHRSSFNVTSFNGSTTLRSIMLFCL